MDKDFRNDRYKLPPEAFAIGPNGPDPEPEDIIDIDTWRGIVSLPDDVSIRTSNDYGTELKAMHDLWSSIIEFTLDKQDRIFYILPDISDALQASLFNLLCGFYKISATSLRSAIENLVIGTYLHLEKEENETHQWKEGKSTYKFGSICDLLPQNADIKDIENMLEEKMQYSIFAQKNTPNGPGWARILFSKLSNFAHANPEHSDANLWKGSNGPIFIPESFGKIYALYLETCALIYVLSKICRQDLELRHATGWLFGSKRVIPSKVAYLSFQYLWGKKFDDFLKK